MSRPNVPITVGVVAATVVVAAAIAIYESPEVRAFALETRRKIAIAFHTIGDEISPNSSQDSRSNPNNRQENGQPRFNRPEDAQGFYEAGVDADEDSRRQQREELMYWNQLRLEVEARKNAVDTAPPQHSNRRMNISSPRFDDFLQEDRNAAKGTMIYNSGADTNDEKRLVQRRGNGIRASGAAGAHGAIEGSSSDNPFADSNNIELKEVVQDPSGDEPLASLGFIDCFEGTMSAIREDTRSETTDYYGVSEADQRTTQSNSRFSTPIIQSSPARAADVYNSTSSWADDVAMEADIREIHSTMSEVSDLEHLSCGELTPTDSMSLIAVEDAAVDDDLSESEGEGISTPDTWSEIGSVVSGTGQYA